MDARKLRQLTAIHRGTRRAHARVFLRCQTFTITLIDELRREEALAQGKSPRLGKFGLRLIERGE